LSNLIQERDFCQNDKAATIHCIVDQIQESFEFRLYVFREFS